jgi:hypothetical protein
MLGHRSITTTARYYAGSVEKKHREAVENLPYASPKVITNLSPIGRQVPPFNGGVVRESAPAITNPSPIRKGLPAESRTA